MKQVQISYELFLALCKYFSMEPESSYRQPLEEAIQPLLQEKMNRVIAHENFTKALSELDELERERGKEAAP